MKGEDEYIDYSCSTPLERLARDVETLLRSWHIIEGSDRHVSFHREKNIPHVNYHHHFHSVSALGTSSNSYTNQSSHEEESENTSMNESVQNDSMLSANEEEKRAVHVTVVPEGAEGEEGEEEGVELKVNSSAENDREEAKEQSEEAKEKGAARGASEGEEEKEQSVSHPSPPSSTVKDKISHETATSSTPNHFTNGHENAMFHSPAYHTPGRIPLDSKLDADNDIKSPNDKTESQTDIRLIRSAKVFLTTIPLHSKSHEDRIQIELELCLWDGPPSSVPIMNTKDTAEHAKKQPPSAPTNAAKASMTSKSKSKSARQAARKKEKRNVPLSLKSNRQFTSLNCNLLSNLSYLLGIGQHLTLTPTSQTTIDLCLTTTMNALLKAQQPSRWDRNTYSFLGSRRRTVEQDVALYSTTLHSLSNQLQMALNTATAACDCRIPAFGIWGLYKSSVEQQQLQNQQHHDQPDSDLLTQSQSIMDIPAWMNAGNLFTIAAESSSIGAFLRYVETMRQEEENDWMNIEDDSSTESDLDVSNHGAINRRLSPALSSPYSNLQSPSYMTMTGTMSPMMRSASVRKRRTSSKQTRKFKRSSSYRQSSSSYNSSQYGKQLFLPPFINGNCHPGSSFFGIGASFAIHVVPPGVDYPLHCTALNSLSQLLLQHCPSVSLSGVLKMQLDSQSKSSKKTSKVKKVNFEDRNIQGKVAVVAARHKYTWTNIFQYSEDYIPRQDDMLLSSPSSSRYLESWSQFNILTFGLSWRECCEMNTFYFQTASNNRDFGDNNNSGSGKGTKTLSPIIRYRQKCREYALKRLYRIICIAKTRKSRKLAVSKKSLEPLWGPLADPVTMISVAVTWGTISNWSNPESNDKSWKKNEVPLLTLPLRIRSQNCMSSQDVLEMENTILSTIFNPLSVPESDFLVNVSMDPDAACTTLSATNRCLLAALIRTSTLESDTLIAHITKSNILEKLHDLHELDFVAEEIMDKASLSPVTRKLVEVMDWGSMADLVDEESWGNEERFQTIIHQIMQASRYPSPPEEVFDPSHIVTDMFESESASHSFIEKGSPHGRLLSSLFTSMASLKMPSTMSALWLAFVSEMRMSWEQRERLNNLNHVPGIDDVMPTGKYHSRRNKYQTSHILGNQAMNAAFVNSTEPDPNLNECLINQKLQVFNIGVETMISMEIKELQEYENQESITEPPPQSVKNDIGTPQKPKIRFSVKDEEGSINSKSESCDFRSCGTREQITDTMASPARPDHVVLRSRLIPPSPLREGTFGTIQIDARRGARCPVHGCSLVSSGDQVFAPYLQRAMPLTDDLLIERREMLAENSTNTIETRIEVAHRLQKPKLVNDMCAFRAANPGAVFQDFTSWYGNPENPLQMYEENDIFNSTEFLTTSKEKSPEVEMAEAILVLNATRSFWTECWNESEPIPASDQKPLFDAYNTVEMLLLSLESMHPAVLLNQILAVNLSSANFILKASAPSYRVKTVDDALDRMERHINKATILLSKDAGNSTKMLKEDMDEKNPFKFISPETVTACEQACACIGDAEILLSQATSLLTKFSGDVDIVETFLHSNTMAKQRVEARSDASRSGILKAIHLQQQNNSGKIVGGVTDLPSPSVREYILRNRDEKNPCQLTVCIGGTHGLEQGGTNSTKGGIVLALNKCVKGIQ